MAIVTTTRKDATILEATLLPLTTFVVVLRFLARRKLRLKLWWDDWFALVAWVILTAHFAFSLWSDRAGVGVVIDGVMPPTLDEITLSLKTVFADIYLFCFTITAARLSLVFLYQRIFGIYQWLHRFLWAIGVLSVAWLITAGLVIAFRCKPTSAFWDPLKQDSCLNINTIFVITESINCGLDLALVLLPLARIRQLQLSVKERVALGAVFLTGAFVCITSILRIIVNYDVDTVKSLFWLDLQIGMAVICTNLPPLRTYLPKSSSNSTAVGTIVSSVFKKKPSSYRSDNTAVDKFSTDDHVPLSQVWIHGPNGGALSPTRS